MYFYYAALDISSLVYEAGFQTEGGPEIFPLQNIWNLI